MFRQFTLMPHTVGQPGRSRTLSGGARPAAAALWDSVQAAVYGLIRRHYAQEET
jgi:hypothetical protein